MNQNDFANECNINPVQYRRYENNASFPRDEQLEKIFNVLRCHDIKNELGEPINIDNFMDYPFKDTIVNDAETSNQPTIIDIAPMRDAIVKAITESQLKEKLNDNFKKVNHEGKIKIAYYSDDIASNPKYKKDPTE